MAMATYVHEGSTIDYTPTDASVNAGDVVPVGDLVGVAKRDIPVGTLGSLDVEGVFDLPKATGAGTAIDKGKKVYWNDSGKVATTAADDGGTPAKPYVYLGKTTVSAADGDSTVRVRLQQ